MATNPATNVVAARVVYRVRLTWTASSTAGATYIVYRGPNAECLTPIGTSVDTSFVDQNVSTGHTYYYYVIATASNINSVPSNITYITYVGPPGLCYNPDEGAHISGKAESVVATGVVPQGCGESVRLMRLKGNLGKCSK
jgi:hypothetical protein